MSNYAVNILHVLSSGFGNYTEDDLVNTEEYQKYGFSIVDCPICGRKTLDMFWVCPGCGWEYDIFINYEANEKSFCNGCTPDEYRRQYFELYKALVEKENS